MYQFWVLRKAVPLNVQLCWVKGFVGSQAFCMHLRPLKASPSPRGLSHNLTRHLPAFEWGLFQSICPWECQRDGSGSNYPPVLILQSAIIWTPSKIKNRLPGGKLENWHAWPLPYNWPSPLFSDSLWARKYELSGLPCLFFPLMVSFGQAHTVASHFFLLLWECSTG